jgi:uncharacterized membrane protein
MMVVRNFFITFAVFMAIDLLWLGVVAKDLYRSQIGFIMRPSPNWTAALIFYVFYIIGLMFFVIDPALQKQSWQYALLVGAFFGLITYMTYDLTNLATLNNWPLLVTLVDLAWGTSLGGVTALLAYTIIRLFR